ncbi:MAG: hypothetical protein AAF675_15065 [Pseudomonadota bacterium]
MSEAEGSIGCLPYPPGTVLAFETAPFCRYSPSPTGRWAAIKIIAHRKGDAPPDHAVTVIAVLDHVSAMRPSLDALATVGVMKKPAQIHDPRGETVSAYVALYQDEKAAPDLHVLGTLPVSAAEGAFETDGYSPVHALSFLIEFAWRSVHDADALVAEQARLRADAEARVGARARQRRERLRGVTMQILLRETVLVAWEDRAEFISPEFLRLIRRRFRNLLREIQALGPKPRKGDVRLALRLFVEWVNGANAACPDTPIETMEREEPHELLEEVAWAAGQKGLVVEFDDWREW